MLSPKKIDQPVNHDIEDYYGTYAASHFRVAGVDRNGWVTAPYIAFGISGCP